MHNCVTHFWGFFFFRILVLFLGILSLGSYVFLCLMRIRRLVFSINRIIWLVFCITSQYIRILRSFFSLVILLFQNPLISPIIIIFMLFNAVQKTMPTECLFPAFCWATTRVQWYLSMLSFTSLLIFALPLQALYTFDVTGMCDICAFSNEVKEVDVSGVLLWFFVQISSSTHHFPYIP